jgi:hypothetical protein
MAAPIERKVQASTGVAAVSGMALFLLGRYVFKGAVPDVVASWVYVLVPGLLTFAAGYFTKHTPRTPAPPQITFAPTAKLTDEEVDELRKRLAASISTAAVGEVV